MKPLRFYVVRLAFNNFLMANLSGGFQGKGQVNDLFESSKITLTIFNLPQEGG